MDNDTLSATDETLCSGTTEGGAIPEWLSDDGVSILGSLSWRGALGYGWDPDEDYNERGWTYYDEATGVYASGDGCNPYRGERDTDGLSFEQQVKISREIIAEVINEETGADDSQGA